MTQPALAPAPSTELTDLQALNCRLELLCASKDAELAQLRSQLIVERLRKTLGASDAAQLNPQTLTFVEPPVVDLTAAS